ncbi:hypothetical protein NEIFLAOT_00094 [Neisseria flavescens NRL30031/H210]|uniref:Uncharacterized protein n=1 Tax=Neisseria flavescens NRL30031/H210 TaxID=546264 RepID=C0EJK6_NEIFL|nr:hypothetical protein NEIFLAOT_00094 [Neisseria flavescens NRL30031/H210]
MYDLFFRRPETIVSGGYILAKSVFRLISFTFELIDCRIL